jgi:DNA-binding NarL/FixJ family response regulator
MDLSLLSSPSHPATSKHPARIMLAIFPSGDRSDRAPTDSAQGYILHHAEPHELLAAIRALSEGVALRPERIAHKVTVHMLPDDGPGAGPIGLSPRETDVLRAMVDGLSYKMVAHRLGISFETVRTHVKKVYEKLGVHNCTEAVAKALRSGLLH